MVQIGHKWRKLGVKGAQTWHKPSAKTFNVFLLLQEIFKFASISTLWIEKCRRCSEIKWFHSWKWWKKIRRPPIKIVLLFPRMKPLIAPFAHQFYFQFFIHLFLLTFACEPGNLVYNDK
jgi:hypothetical protein